MNQSSVNPQSMATIADVSSKKIRKPYTITKSRENWTEEEHDKFIEALQLFDRDWKKIEDFVGSKSVIQIRSHAQKYFLKVQKNGSVAHVPPPRPKRKASHPYPQKATKTLPSQGHVPYPPALNNLDPEYTPWDEASALMDSASTGTLPSQDYPTIQEAEDTARTRSASNKNVGSVECSTITQSNSSIRSQGNHGSLRHGIPDFAEVYNFIGSVFDPDTKGHVQRLKEMDPINVETVLLLMRNLSVNLSSPNSEQLRKLLPSHDVTSKNIDCEP